MIILKLIYWFIVALITYISLILLKDLIAYITYLIYYKPQGIPYQYNPVFGYISFFISKKGQKDALKNYNEVVNKKFKDNKIIAVNNFDSTQIGLILQDPELIGKFFLKEIDYVVRQNVTDPYFKQSFFWKSGEEAMSIRQAFNDFFQPESLIHFVPSIRKIVDEKMEELKKIYREREQKSEEYIRYDLCQFFPKVFSSLINGLMFGNDFPLIEGKTVPEMVSDVVEFNLVNVLRKPINLLTMGFLNRYLLLPSSREVFRRCRKVEGYILDAIKKRRSLKREERELNLIDLMVNHNESTKSNDVMSDDTMIGNVILFQTAGMDTSKNTTESLIDFLSRNKEKREFLINKILPNLYKAKEDKYKYETYEHNDYLSGLVFEALRAFGPAHMTFPKRFLKDMELGGFKFKKGSYVLMPIYPIHHNEKNYDSPMEFDEKRFLKNEKSRVKRNTYMPFSLGRRACPGKYLSELMIKICIVAFFENFELREIEGKEEPERVIKFSYCVKDCFVDLKVKDE